MGAISRSVRMLDGLGCWLVKGGPVVLKEGSSNLRVRLGGVRSDLSVRWLEGLLGTSFFIVIIIG